MSHNMKALILAAGFGSRLAPITDKYPKALVQVNGKPIIFKQIENLHKNGIFNITIVSGYKADILEDAICSNYQGISFIRNEEYAVTNNMYSAWLARKTVEKGAFLMMNADVFFDATIIKALLECPSKNAVVTDVGTYIEESMKVVAKDNRLIAISKNILKKDALGSSADVYKFSEDGGQIFFAFCEKYIVKRGELKLWSEVALNDAFLHKPFEACPLVGRWMEIDNYADLVQAEKIFTEE